MIIQIRGTSGSGKSTAMRAVIAGLTKRDEGPPEVQYTTGRKRPRSYFFKGLTYVLGHYETACGGCDSIGSAKAVYELTMQMISGPDRAKVILQEGLLLSEDVKWSSQMPDLRVLFLITPVEECLRRIRIRRAEAGNEKPLSEANTRNRIVTIERARGRLEGFGIECRRCSSEQAPEIILKWLS